MNNFTKSIVYSGVVLAAGLVAIFAIYNNMAATPGSTVTMIEPAAGEETMADPSMMDATAEGISNMTTEAGDMAADAADATVEATEDDVDATVETTEDAVDATVEATEGAIEDMTAEPTEEPAAH